MRRNADAKCAFFEKNGVVYLEVKMAKVMKVKCYQFENNTKSTATFPKTANNTTIHTDVRNHCDPMTSSHGFSASGRGKHFTSIFLLKRR